MKKLNLLLLWLCIICTSAIGQINQIKIVSFQVKNTLPAKVDDWSSIPAAIILTAQKAPTVQLREPRMVIQIKGNGAIICGNNQSSALPIGSFDVKTFNTNDITAALGGCKELKEGSYQLCVQFFNLDKIAISNEVCKEFKVESPKLQEYAPPTLITPEDGKRFSEAELTRPLNFRWTPLVPKPQQPVTYRLKVWQLMQGQNGAAAMRTNQPIVTKDVDNITQAVVTGIYTGPCRPPYLCDYVWQVQALNKEGKPIGNNEGKSDVFKFGVQESNTPKPPTLVFPENGTQFRKKSDEDAKLKELTFEKGITFRWTPLVPKPQQPVTYKLKVWQLMQGQNSTEAMRTNKPIIVKDVADITETTVSGIYTGPCRPPYLCEYVWQVQAMDREGKPIGENEAKSEAWLFKIQNNIDIQIDSLKVGCCVNGKQSVYIKIRNNLATPVNVVAIKYKINGVGASINLTPTVPPIPPAQLIAGNGTLTVTASIDCINNLTYLKFLVDAEDVADPANKETEVKSDTLKCVCVLCDEKNFTLNAPSPNITIQNNTIGFNQSLTITTSPSKPIKSIKADLVYFEMTPENNMCIPCNKDAATYGHFTNGTNTQQWNGNVNNVNINITTPQLTPCCSANFKWCIRYKIEFMDCTSCTKLICYEKKKEGCEKVGGDDHQNNNPKK
jgi:hypothetical protein